jgi:hypothetical protein
MEESNWMASTRRFEASELNRPEGELRLACNEPDENRAEACFHPFTARSASPARSSLARL